MIVAAPKTPQPMLMTASLILNLNKAATNAPVHAPVPGRGMRHNSQKEILLIIQYADVAFK